MREWMGSLPENPYPPIMVTVYFREVAHSTSFVKFEQNRLLLSNPWGKWEGEDTVGDFRIEDRENGIWSIDLRKLPGSLGGFVAPWEQAPRAFRTELPRGWIREYFADPSP